MDEVIARLIPILLFAASAPQFALRDTAGATHTTAEWASAKAALVFFVTTDCPIGNSYVPEMNRIREAYAGRGVVVWAVQADPAVAGPVVAKYAADFRYS